MKALSNVAAATGAAADVQAARGAAALANVPEVSDEEFAALYPAGYKGPLIATESTMKLTRNNLKQLVQEEIMGLLEADPAAALRASLASEEEPKGRGHYLPKEEPEPEGPGRDLPREQPEPEPEIDPVAPGAPELSHAEFMQYLADKKVRLDATPVQDLVRDPARTTQAVDVRDQDDEMLDIAATQGSTWRRTPHFSGEGTPVEKPPLRILHPGDRDFRDPGQHARRRAGGVQESTMKLTRNDLKQLVQEETGVLLEAPPIDTSQVQQSSKVTQVLRIIDGMKPEDVQSLIQALQQLGLVPPPA